MRKCANGLSGHSDRLATADVTLPASAAEAAAAVLESEFCHKEVQSVPKAEAWQLKWQHLSPDPSRR